MPNELPILNSPREQTSAERNLVYSTNVTLFAALPDNHRRDLLANSVLCKK